MTDVRRDKAMKHLEDTELFDSKRSYCRQERLGWAVVNIKMAVQHRRRGADGEMHN